MSEPILSVSGLHVTYGTNTAGDHHALDGISLEVRPGERVAVVGESGSGKSTLALAALGLLPRTGRVERGTIRLGGTDITHAPDRVLRGLRGRVAGFVPQDPAVSLNPTLRIGPQVAEAVRRRGVRERHHVEAGVVAALEAAGLDRPELRSRQYPHELSGGMRQRVLIAIALAGEPQLLIADEPTSALDVTVQRRILDHLEEIAADRGIALLLITHDLGVATDRADRLVVLRHGRVVEQGATASVVQHATEPYTRALLGAAPRTDVVPPGLDPAARTVLRLTGVSKAFRLPGAPPLQAVDGVDLTVRAGSTTALVGESGSGKSTTLRIALGLERASAGTVEIDGRDVTTASVGAWRPLRRRIQLVQQNPYGSLDPRFRIADTITEPLRSFRVGSRASRRRRAEELLDLVALPRTVLARRPAELSGGQRQRVAIARALALEPEVVLLDEPVSALDVSVQEQVLQLLEQLQRDLGVAYLIVSHDLGVVGRIAHEVVVLRHGHVVEAGPTARVFREPQDAYTAELLAAVPGRRLLQGVQR